MTYPKVSCLTCDKMIEDDEEFEPDCLKCKTKYNFIELLPENYSALEIFQALNSVFVKEFNMQKIIWNNFKEEINEEGFSKMMNKLSIITEIVKEFSTVKS